MINNGGVDTLRQVEAKYPALLFKQQLTAYVEKIYGMIRDNLKKEISPLLGLCIQVYFLCNYASTNMFKLFFVNFLVSICLNTIYIGTKNIQSKLSEGGTLSSQHCSPASPDCSLARDCEEPWKLLKHFEI